MYEKADELFRTSGIKISPEGDRHLGAVVGTKDFRDRFVKNKVEKWIADVENLCKLFTCQRWTSSCSFNLSQRTSIKEPSIDLPSADSLRCQSHIQTPWRSTLSAIIGRPLSDLDKQNIKLPVRFGELGIRNPRTNCDKEYENWRYVTETLTNQILNQDRSQSPDFKLIETKKNTIREATQQQCDNTTPQEETTAAL